MPELTAPLNGYQGPHPFLYGEKGRDWGKGRYGVALEIAALPAGAEEAMGIWIRRLGHKSRKSRRQGVTRRPPASRGECPSFLSVGLG